MINSLGLIDCQQQWIFLHYHKTGAVLSEAISREISRNRFTYYEDNYKRMDFSMNTNANVVLSHAGNFLFNWTETFSPSHRVIHFVRNPYHMIISGLLYHSQSPPPEGWLLSPSVNPCACDEFYVEKFIETISSYHSRLSRSALGQRIEQTVALCRDIYNKAILKYGVVTYNKVAINLFKDDQFQAVRLEACRALLSKFPGSGGDTLRMAANSVRENQASLLNPMISKRVFLSDFPLGDRKKCQQTLSDLFSFLLTPSLSGKDFWTERLTISQAVEIGLNASYIDNSIYLTKTTVPTKKVHSSRQLVSKPQISRFRLSGGKIKPIIRSQDQPSSGHAPSVSFVRRHITQGILSQQQRNELIMDLQNNSILSPLLNLVQLILTNPQPYKSTSIDVESLLSSYSLVS